MNGICLKIFYLKLFKKKNNSVEATKDIKMGEKISSFISSPNLNRREIDVKYLS
jgi:hypothetical protein